MRYLTLMALLCVCGGCHGVLITRTPAGAPTALNAASKPLNAAAVTYGAVGDGRADDTPALQRALAALAQHGGTLRLTPYATYRTTGFLQVQGASNFTIDLAAATIQVAAGTVTNVGAGDTLRLVNCSNGTVCNGTFDGNRANRPPAPQSNPVTLRIQGCNNITIDNCHFLNDALDGVFVWCATDPTKVDDASKWVAVTRCTFDSPGRNGISIIHGAFCRIADNTFRGAHGLSPSAGIDVEPNPGDAPGITHNIVVEGNTFTDCTAGAAAYAGYLGTYAVVFAHNNVVNCDNGLYSEAVGTVFTANTLANAPLVAANCDKATLLGNVVTGSYLYVDTHGIVAPTGHTVVGNVADVLYTSNAQGRTNVSGNVGTMK